MTDTTRNPLRRRGVAALTGLALLLALTAGSGQPAPLSRPRATGQRATTSDYQRSRPSSSHRRSPC